jgi:hypothetical protein
MAVGKNVYGCHGVFSRYRASPALVGNLPLKSAAARVQRLRMICSTALSVNPRRRSSAQQARHETKLYLSKL